MMMKKNQDEEDPEGGEEEANTRKRKPAIMGFLIEQLGTRNPNYMELLLFIFAAKRQCWLSRCDDTKIGNRHRRFALKRFLDY